MLTCASPLFTSDRPPAATARLLRSAQTALERQLACLDPAFVTTFDADAPLADAPADATRLAAFLRLPPPLTRAVARAMGENRSLIRLHPPIDPALRAYISRSWW